jgi:septal ring factor EnvC (AmiA/AmiB activator)
MAATTANKTVPNGDGQNGWAEYRRLVLAELERLGTQVAVTQTQGQNTQMAMAQALNDAKAHILDKLRDTVRTMDDDFEKKIRDIEEEAAKKAKEVETRHEKQIGELKKTITKHENDLEKTEKKLEKIDKELTSFKAKVIMLGAVAGFVVAVIDIVVSISIKK